MSASAKTATSSKTQSQAGAGGDEERDVLPDPIDDALDGEPVAGNEPQSEEREAPVKDEIDPESPVGRRAAALAALSKRSREVREEEAESEKPSEPAGENESKEETTGGGESEDGGNVEETQDETAAQTPQEKKFKLKIDGKIVEKTESEVLALAQIAEAGNNRFEKSKEAASEALRLLSEAKTLRDQLTANQRGTTAQEPDRSQATSSPENPPDPQAQEQAEEKALEKLKAVAERLQVGDATEGAQALLEIMSDLRKEVAGELKKGESVDPLEFDRRVDQRVAQRQAKEEIAAAVAKFGSEYPEIVKRPYVKEAARAVARDEMLEDWLKGGATEDEVKPWRRAEPEAVALVHQQMKVAGIVGVRSYDEILKAAAEKLGREFNIGTGVKPGAKQGQSAPATRITVDPKEAEARIAAKRQQQQPKTAGGRGQIAQAQRPKTTSEIIASMRRGRAGQS